VRESSSIRYKDGGIKESLRDRGIRRSPRIEVSIYRFIRKIRVLLRF